MTPSLQSIQALIEALEEYNERDKTCGMDCDQLRQWFEQCCDSLDSLKQLLADNSWIPCSEKMPPQGVDVWAYWPAIEESDESPDGLCEWVGRASWIPARGKNNGWSWHESDYSGTQLPTFWRKLPPGPSAPETTEEGRAELGYKK